MSLIGHRPVSTVGTAYCFSLFVKGQGTLLSPSFHLQHVEPMPVQVSDTPLGVDLQHISTFFFPAGTPNACFLMENTKKTGSVLSATTVRLARHSVPAALQL